MRARRLSSAPPESQVIAATAPARRRWPLVVVGLLLLLLLLLLLFVAAIAAYRWAGNETALRYAVEQFAARTGGRVTAENVTGSLFSTLRAGVIRYHDGDIVVRADDVVIEWSPRALLSRTLHIAQLHARQLDIKLGPGDDAPLRLPASLALPVSVAIDRAAIDEINIDRGKAHWTLSGLAFGYDGGPDGHRLHDLALTADAGALAGALAVAARPPFAVSGNLALTGTEALHRPVVNVAIGGILEALDINATGRVAQASVRGNARFSPIAKVPLQSFDVDVRDLDLHALDAALPNSALDVAMHGTGAEGGVFAGTFEATNKVPGAIDAGRVPLHRLSSTFRLTPDNIALSDLVGTLGKGGSVTGSGSLTLTAGVPGAAGSAWALALRDVDLHAIHTALIATQLSGTVRADGTTDVTNPRQHIVADVKERDMALAFEATVAGTDIDIARFQARAQGGELAGQGRFNWAGERPFAIKATATHLDPARFGDFPQASLDGTVDAAGTLRPAWAATGRLALATTTRWRESPVSGTLSGAFSQDRVRDVAAHVRIAGNTIDATGSLGRAGDRLQFTIDAQRVAALSSLAGDRWPQGLAGAVHATGHLDGTLDGTLAGLGIGVDARVRDFTAAGLSVAAGTLNASVPPASGSNTAALRSRPITASVDVTGLAVAGKHYSHAAATFTGTLAAHTATLAAVSDDLDAKAQLQGSFAPGAIVGSAPLAWSGTLAAFDNKGPYPVRLLAPAQIQASATRIVVADARLTVADGTLRVASFAWNEGRITTKGDFTELPMAAVARFAGTELQFRTTLVLGGEWDIAANPRLNGSLHIRRQSGDLFMGTTQALEAGEIALGVSELAIDATLQDDAVNANAALRGTRLGDVRATIALVRAPGALPGHIDGNAPITASIKGTLSSLRPLQPLLGTAALVEGALALDVAVGGTIGQPVATGTITARNLRLDSPKFGLNWHDGRGVARIAKGEITLEDVSFAAGDGRFTVAGNIPLAALRAKKPGAAVAAARLTWHAQNFRATNRPDLRLVVSGDGTLGFEQGKLALAGEVRVEDGRIDFETTPGATLSGDVVIVGRPRPELQRAFDNLPLALDLHVDLGQRLRISGQGLRATLQGDVRVTTSQGGALRAQGTLRTVDGTYLAFGQQLQIERGRLTFDGPIDNPALDIVALRKNLPVEAGVALSGTARLPQVQLTSNPPVPDGEKLSWLVLGQGLDRSSGADLAALQAAAGALFGKGGPSFGTRIAQSVGLDDLALRSTGTSGSGAAGQVLALSKRLSDRLYLIFEQGLTAANTALKIDFTLTKSLTLRAQAGSVSSLGVYFLRSFE